MSSFRIRRHGSSSSRLDPSPKDSGQAAVRASAGGTGWVPPPSLAARQESRLEAGGTTGIRSARDPAERGGKRSGLAVWALGLMVWAISVSAPTPVGGAPPELRGALFASRSGLRDARPTLSTFHSQLSTVNSQENLSVAKSASGYTLTAEGLGNFYATANEIANARMISVPGSRAQLLLWQEKLPDGRLADFYAISLDGQRVARVLQTSYDLLLRYRQFDPLLPLRAPTSRGATVDSGGLPEAQSSNGKWEISNLRLATSAGQTPWSLMTPPRFHRGEDAEGVYIAQFVTQPLEEFREHIRALGGTIYKYVAHHAYLVKMDAATRGAVEALPFVRWVGAYEPAYKLEEFLLARLFGSGARTPPEISDFKFEISNLRLEISEGLPDQRYNIQVFERGAAELPLAGGATQSRLEAGGTGSPTQQERVAERVRELGGIVHAIEPKGFLVEATLSAEALVALAQLPEVQFMDRWSEPEADVTTAREIGGADYIEEAGGFTGADVRGEVMDLGVRTTHVDFQSRPLLIHGPTPPSRSHGTSTTGIVFGDGTGDLRGRGLLPSGQGIVASTVSGSRRYEHTAELLQEPYFAVFQSNSWGSGLTTVYNTVSAQMDDILFQNDFLITQSQSNTGNRNSRPEAWAKNIVSVGGILHRGTVEMGDDCWCGRASIGPAADDRIKPDFAHFYDRNFTPSGRSDTDYSSGFGGTSAATPIVAGHFGLFFEMWHNGIFGNPTGETVFDSRPRMATAKAVLINTARQWNFSGESHDLTRTHQGWGLPDLQNLYDLRDNIFIVNQTDVLRALETRAYTLEAAADGVPLRATLVYTDPPGTTSSSQHRINDLTLKLNSPSGTVYFGNNGLRGNMWSLPGGAPDTKNTVENVFLENPEPGTWTIEVLASEINEDQHLDTPEVDADYALVVSGVWPPAAANRGPQ